MPLASQPFLALAALLLGADAGAVPGVTAGEVLLGMSAPLSGPAASWGSLATAAEAWARHVNQQGGVHGRRVRLLLRDDGYVPGRAVANLQDMKGEVLAVLGVMGTAVVGACAGPVAEAGLPWIYPLANPRLFAVLPAGERRTVFVEYPDYADEGEYLARQAAAREGVRRIAFFGQNDDYGRSGLDGVRRAVKDTPGLQLSAEALYDVSDREVGTQAVRIRDAGAEAVVIYATPVHAAGLVKELARLGARPKLFASFTLSDRDRMFGLLGELWEGAYYDTHLAQRGEPAADRVLEVLLRLAPELKGREGTAVHGAMVMMVAVEALRRAGPEPTRERLLAALESLRGWSPEGLTAPVTFGPGRHHGLNGVRLLQAGKAADRSFRQVAPAVEFRPWF